MKMTEQKKLKLYADFVERLKTFNWYVYDKYDSSFDKSVKDAIDDMIWHLEVDLME